MSRWGWKYDYVPSDVPLSVEQFAGPHGLFIFSDYPAAQIDRAAQELVAEKVRLGAGLLMIGGWESYHGLGGQLGRHADRRLAAGDDFPDG